METHLTHFHYACVLNTCRFQHFFFAVSKVPFQKSRNCKPFPLELAKPKYNRSVLYCSLLSQASLGDMATTMFLICSNSHSQPPENPTLWLRYWSIQRVEKVTLILDNADHVLESGDRQEFVNMLRDLRIYSRQSLSFIITSRKTVDTSSCGFKIENIRLTS